MEMTDIFMKIDEHLLKFPRYLPNDLEAFMVFYPNKFPLIVSYFEKVAKKIGADSKAYQEYGDWAHDELFAGFEKIKKDYEQGDQTSLEFLIDTDQRFHKLICFRFWIVNYLFADGPLHDYFVDNLKNLIRKFIDVTEDIEDFEGKVVRIQRDLLQGDYADLYLRQALSGVDLMKLLNENPKTRKLVDKATKLIDAHSHRDAGEINVIWDKVTEIVKNESDPESTLLREELLIPLEQAKMRNSPLPIYNMLTHAVEFRVENKELAKRSGGMQEKINDLMSQAKQGLTPEEFELFELSYQQARNFSMYKDIMGEIDGPLLPLWFGIHHKIKAILSKDRELKFRPTGHSAVFYYFVWYLPMELQHRVMTPDLTPFSLESL